MAAVTVEKARGDRFIVFLLIGNATVAYLVNLTNFLVTKHTSALTLQVLGNAKAAVAAVVSVLIFKNPVNVMGITGFAVTIMGVIQLRRQNTNIQFSSAVFKQTTARLLPSFFSLIETCRI